MVKLVTEKAYVGWYCYTDNYDGAPDACDCLGNHLASGDTESEAVLNWLEEVKSYYPNEVKIP